MMQCIGRDFSNDLTYGGSWYAIIHRSGFNYDVIYGEAMYWEAMYWGTGSHFSFFPFTDCFLSYSVRVSS